jgi:CBS domain-containing protein
MNVLFFLTPKANCTCLYEDYTIRQALERMENAHYAALPILRRDGGYVGTMTEGDLLWAIKNLYMMNMREAEKHPITEINRRCDNRPVSVDTNIDDLVATATEQNFVPVVDDKGDFIGLVTRKAIMQYCLSNYIRPREKVAI